jgi:hypothetical protein
MRNTNPVALKVSHSKKRAYEQVPKRIYTLEELRLNKIEPEKLLSPQDNTLGNVRNVLQVNPQSLPCIEYASDRI